MIQFLGIFITFVMGFCCGASFIILECLKEKWGKNSMDRLISEKQVIEAFREHQGSISDFIKAVEAIPSAEPKTGHWIEHPEIETSTPEYLMFYECSECGDKQCFCKSDIHKKHFCNNCGAKMVEPQESEVEE